jgi:trigger factor
VSTSTLTRLAPTQVELEIPITAEELAAAQERAFRRLAKNVKLPGFRAGKVPRKVFEQTYGSESIASEALEDVVPEVYARAVREHELVPVDRPRMEILPAEEGKPSRLKATVDVRPAIALREYKGIEVERDAPAIDDEDVERSLQALAKERATLVPVERPAQLGDVVTLDYEGKIDGVPFDGGTAKGQMTELDENRFIPGFASGIAGMNAGETKDVEAVFPSEYPKEDLAGKTAVFTVTVHDVKALELPAIDDEFAKAISENETVDALRVDVRKRLEAIAQSRARRAIGNALMEKLVDAHEFPLPQVLVDREIDNMINDLTAQITQSGLSFDDYLKEQGKTEDELRESYRNDAEQRVKGTLVIEEIARTEGINATPADVAEELSALSRQYGQPVDRIRKALGNNVIPLMEGIVRNKTLEFLVDNARVVDTKSSNPSTVPPG